MARKKPGWLLHAISLIGLAAGLFCLYKALSPMITMYADTLSDPLGNAHADPDVKQIQHQALLWAPIGVACIVLASIVSWIATIGWLRRAISGGKNVPR